MNAGSQRVIEPVRRHIGPACFVADSGKAPWLMIPGPDRTGAPVSGRYGCGAVDN